MSDDVGGVDAARLGEVWRARYGEVSRRRRLDYNTEAFTDTPERVQATGAELAAMNATLWELHGERLQRIADHVRAHQHDRTDRHLPQLVVVRCSRRGHVCAIVAETPHGLTLLGNTTDDDGLELPPLVGPDARDELGRGRLVAASLLLADKATAAPVAVTCKCKSSTEEFDRAEASAKAREVQARPVRPKRERPAKLIARAAPGTPESAGLA